ncbi:hypothetical protein TI39_contig273g00005 [Zymoseptoria brevis]|uniref:Vacuolar ATPase assembly protein VMA22 n=1 Tax=Zymoseptoria brevis TaxID=1047168 RepID=A0A0F4GWW1_9PEZI|nr:hypothetical protein TI39_contig273g00005 [Zymoseptoria brevis]
MANVQGPSSDNSIIDLHDQLDTLWARYLDLLDEYTAAQEAIRTHLSSGFLFLAKANFHSSGRRYGQDFYDQRAMATTRVAFKTEGERLNISVIRLDSNPQSEQAETSKQDSTSSPEPPKTSSEPKEASVNHLPSPSPTPEPEILEEKRKDSEETLSKPKLQSPDPQDPIRQFGILIPPALRSAQTSFSKAVLSPEALARAVQAARELRGVEVEMRRARKGLRKAEKAGG